MILTHADVHESIARTLHGTTLLSFMVTTQSIQHEDGSIAVEWSVVISSGREPVIYQRARDPEKLVNDTRVAVDRRRAFYSATPPILKTLRGAPPADTALADPKRSPSEPPSYNPTAGGEF